MEEQSQINKKDMPLEQDLIIVKIYSPFGDLLAGNYEKIQKAIDQKLFEKGLGINKNIILYGQNNAGGNVYLGYADNSDGPATTIESVLLIEYFCGENDHEAVEIIHQAITGQYGATHTNPAIKIKYMIINNVDMMSLDPSVSHN